MNVTKIVRIKKLPETNVVRSERIEKLAEMLIKTEGTSPFPPVLIRVGEGENYQIQSGFELIEAAKLAAKQGGINTLTVTLSESEEIDEIFAEMQELVVAPTPAAPKEMTREEKVAMIAKLAAELA